MVNINDIQSIVNSVIGDYKKKKKFVNPNPIYQDAVEMAYDILPHADPRVYPEKLFATKAPNEQKEEAEYRRASYQNNTAQYWTRALSMVNRIWNEQNWSLVFNEDDRIYRSEGMAQYVYDDYPRGESLIDYFKDRVTKFKDNDPNGVLCVRPKFKYLERDGQVIINEDGMPVVDDRELISPVAYIYPSVKVIDFKESEYALILTSEKSEVTVGGQKKRDGIVFEFYDDTNIYRISQYGEQQEYTFDFILYYNHNIGELPASRLKGIAIGSDDNDGYQLYKSPFYDAVPTLNTALYNNSNLQISIAAHVFLEKWEYVNECDQCGGQGTIYTNNEEHDCRACGTTGYVQKTGPLNVYQIRAKGQTVADDDLISPPPAGYIQKPTEILTFLRQSIADDKNDAMRMVNLDVSGKVSGTETATGRFIDREEMMSFLMLEAQQNFELLDKTLWWIGLMRYGTSYNGHTLYRPNEFSISTSADLTTELKEASDSDITPSLRRRLETQYAKSRFNTDSDKAVRELDIVYYVDGLMMLTEDQILNRLNSGVVAKWQVLLHDYIYSFLEQKVKENPDYYQTEIAVIKQDLEQMAKALDLQNNPVVNGASIIDGLADGIGKLPLAVQQLALARKRADESGDEALSQKLGDAIERLTDQL